MLSSNVVLTASESGFSTKEEYAQFPTGPLREIAQMNPTTPAASPTTLLTNPLWAPLKTAAASTATTIMSYINEN